MIVLPPLRALILALVLGALCASAVACGQDSDDGLLSAARAENLKAQLDNIDEDVVKTRCEQALTDHLNALKREIDDLPGTVDADLRRTLREGQEHLMEIAPAECGADEPDATTTTTETIPTTPTETIPTTPTEPVETTPTEPVETTPTEPPVETTPVDPTQTGPSGGEEAPIP